MYKVSIIGATGYTGAELVRLLSNHPEVELTGLTTQQYAGMPFWEVYPHLYKYVELTCRGQNIKEIIDCSDIIFSALPHGHSMSIAAEAMRQKKVFIDLAADFRLRDAASYESWYKVEHTARELLEKAVYGLPEIYRKEIAATQLVANPGCYPTTVILGLAPLLRKGLIATDSVIIDSKSGVSGAGRGLSLNVHYCEVNENIKAYGVTTHRHLPEIEQELGLLAGKEMVVSFTPHLTPMTRGMLSTIYSTLNNKLDTEELLKIYTEFYAGEPFVRVLPAGMLPASKMVSGSNYCDLGMVTDRHTGRLVVISAIDNLIKGASGQAVQNMNIMLGLPEETGLAGVGIYP